MDAPKISSRLIFFPRVKTTVFKQQCRLSDFLCRQCDYVFFRCELE